MRVAIVKRSGNSVFQSHSRFAESRRAKASKKSTNPGKPRISILEGFARIGRSIMAASTTIGRRTSVRGLGEIALRVKNLDAMQKFYEEVIGLPLMARDSDSAFFKIAEG